ALGAASSVVLNNLLSQLESSSGDALSPSEKEARVNLVKTLVAGVTAAAGGDAAAATVAATLETENNALSNERGVALLDEAGKALYEKLRDAGVGSADDLQARLKACNGESGCEQEARQAYRDELDKAGSLLVAMSRAGDLSEEEYQLLVTSYARAMMAGLKQAQDESGGSGWLGDIYDASAVDWSPAGLLSNPYVAAIRSGQLIAQWQSEGLSAEQIEDRLRQDEVLGSYLGVTDRNEIVALIDRGVTGDDVLAAAVGAVFKKAVNNAVAKYGSTNNFNKNELGGSESLEYKPASYHGRTDSLLKSRAPANGQAALDYSIQVKSTSPRRVGIDYSNKEFVVFDKTIGAEYHGHVRAWKDLHPDMRNALIRSGMADSKGAILPGR
ncbi:MAG: hypothetical protein ABN482_01240, partial [Corticimicrobacter sp.]|uniref:hypothetical protein n=1 Tax=Corticimicrobacter sp. TaxID=2678536 RepID=UPI0032D9C9CB